MIEYWLISLRSCCSSWFVLPSSTRRKEKLIPSRIPNSSPGLPIWIFLILVHWSWNLYVSPGHPSLEHLLTVVIAVYIFAGSILLEEHILTKIFGTIIGFIGIAYVILEFVPSIEPPQNMREADGGWGAEQV